VSEQTIVRVAGLRGEYVFKGEARNGDVTVFGPVIWSETRRRYGDRVDIQQLAMTVRR
jgi:hypothetical protein